MTCSSASWRSSWKRYNADKQIREVLSEDQKKKLDQFEQEPHPEMHGNLRGATSSPPQTPKI
jgi:hypothetical protein